MIWDSSPEGPEQSLNLDSREPSAASPKSELQEGLPRFAASKSCREGFLPPWVASSCCSPGLWVTLQPLLFRKGGCHNLPACGFASSPQIFLGHFIWGLKIAAVEIVATRKEGVWMGHEQNSAPPSPALLNNMAQKGLCNCCPSILEQLLLARFTLTTKQKRLFLLHFLFGGAKQLSERQGWKDPRTPGGPQHPRGAFMAAI